MLRYTVVIAVGVVLLAAGLVLFFLFGRNAVNTLGWLLGPLVWFVGSLLVVGGLGARLLNARSTPVTSAGSTVMTNDGEKNSRRAA